MRLVIVFILPIALVLAITKLLEPLESPIDRGGLEAEAMVWGDRVFTSKAELAAWLETRGIDYEDWVARHPGAAPWENASRAQAARPVGDNPTQDQQPPPERSAAPTPQPKPRPEPQRQAAETAVREPPPSEAAPPVASVDSGSDSSSRLRPLLGPLLLGLIGIVGLLLITASAIPPMWYVAHAQAGLVVVDRRAEFAVAGLAMLVGLGIPILL